MPYIPKEVEIQKGHFEIEKRKLLKNDELTGETKRRKLIEMERDFFTLSFAKRFGIGEIPLFIQRDLGLTYESSYGDQFNH